MSEQRPGHARPVTYLGAIGALALTCAAAAAAPEAPLRPPAVPLIVRSPYVSVWQPANVLPGTNPAFWTGSPRPMTGIARVDGQPYVFLGASRTLAQGLTQTALSVTPTQSRYTLTGGGVTLDLDFLSPVEAGDLRRLSMPFGYVFAQARSADGRPHRVSLYFDIGAAWGQADPAGQVVWKRVDVPGGAGGPLRAFTVSPADPKPLAEHDDAPTWGSAVFATPVRPGLTSQAGGDEAVRERGATQDALDNSVDAQMPQAVYAPADPNRRRQRPEHGPVFAFAMDLGQVTARPGPARVLLLGHVREPAVTYLGQPVPPLWRAYWPDWQSMLAFAASDADAARRRADALDARVMADANRAGGPEYAALCALAFRQAFGATEMVGTADKPWMFLKEISSDGNISTVDVMYPAFPVFLYTNPTLLRLQLDPLLAYAETGGWPKPFAEHDIGAAYPNAAGHNNGEEEDMPVEESANMLIMAAAYLNAAPPADAKAYATQHYAILKQWADYEVQNGLDPALQNQTDDFTGFIKSSANLALKAIVGVGAMGQIAAHAGNAADAQHYAATSRTMIGQWVKLAQAGDHLVLAYGQPQTWSLKYNAFPDKVLGLHLIPDSVLQEEARYYTTRENGFGIPLDGRHSYTKTDWEMWTAASTDDPALRRFFIHSILQFVNTSQFRGAFSDWYDTLSGQQVGFVARPVIGGVFALVARQTQGQTNHAR